jgi:hypothetical protein
MGILKITGILFTGAIVLVFLFRWILMVEKIIDEQKKSLEKTLDTADKLIEFIDKNIKERIVYTSQEAYDNTAKIDPTLPIEGESAPEEPEEMTMENIQDVRRIKDNEPEGKKE